MIVPAEKQAEHYGQKGLDLTKLRASDKWCTEFLLNLLGAQCIVHASVAIQYTAYLRHSNSVTYVTGNPRSQISSLTPFTALIHFSLQYLLIQL